MPPTMIRKTLQVAQLPQRDRESPYDVSQLKSCQLLHNCTKKSHLTGRIALSCGIKISLVGSLDQSQSMRVTDGQTDRIMTPNGKNHRPRC